MRINHGGEGSLQQCRRVIAKPIAATHGDHLDYPHEAVTNLMVAIYQCKADLKRFQEIYEDKMVAFKSNMRTNLKKQFQSHQTKAAESWQVYGA